MVNVKICWEFFFPGFDLHVKIDNNVKSFRQNIWVFVSERIKKRTLKNVHNFYYLFKIEKCRFSNENILTNLLHVIGYCRVIYPYIVGLGTYPLRVMRYYIIIKFLVCRQHVFLWFSLTLSLSISLKRPSLLVSRLIRIKCLNRCDKYKFFLVCPWKDIKGTSYVSSCLLWQQWMKIMLSPD